MRCLEHAASALALFLARPWCQIQGSKTPRVLRVTGCGRVVEMEFVNECGAVCAYALYERRW